MISKLTKYQALLARAATHTVPTQKRAAKSGGAWRERVLAQPRVMLYAVGARAKGEKGAMPERGHRELACQGSFTFAKTNQKREA